MFSATLSREYIEVIVEIRYQIICMGRHDVIYFPATAEQAICLSGVSYRSLPS